MDDLADVIINLFVQLDKHFLPLLSRKIKKGWDDFRDSFFIHVEQHHLQVISSLDNDISNISNNLDMLKSLPSNDLVLSKIAKLTADLDTAKNERNKNAQILAKLQGATTLRKGDLK